MDIEGTTSFFSGHKDLDEGGVEYEAVQRMLEGAAMYSRLDQSSFGPVKVWVIDDLSEGTIVLNWRQAQKVLHVLLDEFVVSVSE